MPEIDTSLKDLIDEKVHEEMDKEVNQYPVKLSWKQVYAGGLVALGLVSTIFGAGYKVNSTVNKVELAKQATSFQEQLGIVEKEKIKLSTKLTNAEEEVKYFQGRYEITNTRLTACMKKRDVYETFIMDCDSKTQAAVKKQLDAISE